MKQTKSHHIVLDSKDGITCFTSDAAREMVGLKDFPWDDTLTHVNGMALPYNAVAG